VPLRILVTYLVRRFLKIHVAASVYVSNLSSTCLTFALAAVQSLVAIYRHERPPRAWGRCEPHCGEATGRCR
jgi:hypothetical protein